MPLVALDLVLFVCFFALLFLDENCNPGWIAVVRLDLWLCRDATKNETICGLLGYRPYSRGAPSPGDITHTQLRREARLNTENISVGELSRPKSKFFFRTLLPWYNFGPQLEQRDSMKALKLHGHEDCRKRKFRNEARVRRRRNVFKDGPTVSLFSCSTR